MKRSDTASPARRRVSDATILMLVTLLPAIYAFLALFVFPVQYVSLVTEGALGETATAVFLILAAVLIGRQTVRIRREEGSWIMPGLFAGAMLVVGMEEISWGARWLGIELPAVQRLNRQGEINLHNLLPIQGLQLVLGPLIAGIYGIVLPIAYRRMDSIRKRVDRWHLLVPPLAAVPLMAVAAVTFAFPLVFKYAELAELLFSVGILATAGTFGLGHDPQRALRRSVAVLGAGLALALAAVQFGPRAVVENREYRTRMLMADFYYARHGMSGMAQSLLRNEMQRATGWLNVGTAVGPMTGIALKDVLHGDGPGEPFLDQAAKRGLADLAHNHIDLAVLSYLSGHDADALHHISAAELLVVEHETRHGKVRRRDLPMLLAKLRLLACRGRIDEARELLAPTGSAGSWRGHRIRLAWDDRIRALALACVGQPVPD